MFKKVTFGKYILDKDGNPKPEEDLLTWASWMESGDRKVKKTKVGKAEVSTIFVGIDHGYNSKNEPILFETVVFGGRYNEEQERYATRKEAVKGHNRLVKLINS